MSESMQPLLQRVRDAALLWAKATEDGSHSGHQFSRFPKQIMKSLVALQRRMVEARGALTPKDEAVRRIALWRHGKLPRVPLTAAFPGIEKVHVTVRGRPANPAMEPTEILCLIAMAKMSSASNILEIGTFDGNTALNLAMNAPPHARVTTIDLPPDWNGELGLKVHEGFQNVSDRSGVARQYRDTSWEGKIEQVWGDSAKIDWSKMRAPFDFIFIDGCHYYSYVKRDTENALSHLTRPGMIVWHDYGGVRDVSWVVDSLIGQFPIYAISGTRLAVGLIR